MHLKEKPIWTTTVSTNTRPTPEAKTINFAVIRARFTRQRGHQLGVEKYANAAPAYKAGIAYAIASGATSQAPNSVLGPQPANQFRITPMLMRLSG